MMWLYNTVSLLRCPFLRHVYVFLVFHVELGNLHRTLISQLAGAVEYTDCFSAEG